MTEPPAPQPQQGPFDDDTRKRAVANAIQGEVLRGGRVESQSDFQAVIVHGRPVNHVLHLILTLITCGLWGVVWLLLVLTGGEKRVTLAADEWGHLLRQQI